MKTTTSSATQKCFLALAGATCFTLGIATPSLAASLSYTGTTVGEATWSRPLANGVNPPVALAAVGTNVPFSAFQFNVDTTGAYDFLSTSTDPANWDNYTFLYVNSFDSTNPLDNIVIANNNFPTKGLSGFNNVSLTAGLNYFLVTSGFADADAGAFLNTISSANRIIAGPATPIPTPALLPGLIGMGITLLRKKKANSAETL